MLTLDANDLALVTGGKKLDIEHAMVAAASWTPVGAAAGTAIGASVGAVLGATTTLPFFGAGALPGATMSANSSGERFASHPVARESSRSARRS